jgi:hypothetical protein
MQFVFAIDMSGPVAAPAMSFPMSALLLLELPQLANAKPPAAATAKAKIICRIEASGNMLQLLALHTMCRRSRKVKNAPFAHKSARLAAPCGFFRPAC